MNRFAFSKARATTILGPLLLGFLLLKTVAWSKLPELDAVYFRRILQNTTEPVVPNLAGQVAVVAKLNGIEIARAALNSEVGDQKSEVA